MCCKEGESIWKLTDLIPTTCNMQCNNILKFDKAEKLRMRQTAYDSTEILGVILVCSQ
jgi:hypothetical protein